MSEPKLSDHPLAVLLPGVDLDDFHARHFGQRSLHRSGPVERYAEVYDLQAFERLEHILAIDAATRDAKGRQQQVRIEPWQAPALRTAGVTLCADVRTEPLLARFLDRLQRRMDTGPGGFAKLYVSADGAGFATHFDRDHVFVLQLVGSKRWRYGEQPVAPWTLCGGKLGPHGHPVHTHPRDGEPVIVDGRPLPAPTPDSLQTITLQPGDVLYLPPGTWHETRAKGDSVALSVSVPRRSALEVVLDELRDRLSEDPRLWRDISVPPSQAVPGPVPAAAIEALGGVVERVRAGLQGLDSDVLVQRWCRQVYGVPPLEPTSAALTRSVERSHRLALADPRGLVWMMDRDPDGAEVVVIHAMGEAFTLPGQARPFVEALARHRSFVAEQAAKWDPQLDWSGTAEVLGQLLEAGVLVHEP